MFQQFRQSTWGGWEPPNRELSLSKSELKWKKEFEEKHKCKITYIGLDDAFMEDTVIYMNVKCDTNSDLQLTLNDSFPLFTKNLATSFLGISKESRTQKCFQVSYGNIYFDESGRKLKYPKAITYRCTIE